MNAWSLAAAAALMLAATPGAQAADLNAMVVVPAAAALQAIGPGCAAQGGDTLAMAPAPAPDAPATPGERPPLDVVVHTSAQIDRLIAEGAVVAGSKVDIGSSRVGLAIRQGAATPDLSTPEALKQVVLNARSFGYSPYASGVFLSTEVLPKLGVWDQVKDRGKVIRGELVGMAVARGDVEVGFQQLPEILAVPTVQLAGPLPAALQLVTKYSAAVATASTSPADARAFVACLIAPAAAAQFLKAGFDPVPR